MPPNSRKCGLMGRLSSLFRGRSSRSAVECSEPVAKIANKGAGPLPLHDRSTGSIPLTPANNSTGSSAQDYISQLPKRRATKEIKPVEPAVASTADAGTCLAASTSTPITEDPISPSLIQLPAREGSPLPLVASSSTPIPPSLIQSTAGEGSTLSHHASASVSGPPRAAISGEETVELSSISPHAPSHVALTFNSVPSETVVQVTPPGHSFLNGAHHFQMGNLQLLDAPNATHVSTLNVDHQSNTFIAGNQYLLSVGEDLIRRLNPILDASHTRNRARSPPDSECFPGTREEPIHEIIVWADSGEMIRICTQKADLDSYLPAKYTVKRTPQIYWLHGFAGCGKSSISLEVAKIYAKSGRLIASYFFFRGAGDRSTMHRFAVTLASQMVAAIPATAPLIEAAVRKEPGLATGDVSLAMQLDLLIFSPFQAALNRGDPEETLAKGPFLIVVDGLDECEDKRGVEEFMDHILAFFEKHPSIPLRILITSRVEQHIRERLETDGVLLSDLNSHLPLSDITKYLEAAFRVAAERNRVIRAYVREHGEWPAPLDMGNLINHVGQSFVLASTIFKFIVQPATTEGPLTPMERLPLALNMNGLDGLYSQTLARSQHLPHFPDILSAITLLRDSLPIMGIADLLGIQAFEVIRVLLNLQTIIHVPGTDKEGEVTLCHTSLRDFLTTKTRSESFFVSPLSHLRLSYFSFASIFEWSDRRTNYDFLWIVADHLRLFAFACPEPCDEIQQFQAQQFQFVDRLPPSTWHAFLCVVWTHSITWNISLIADRFLYMLTECTEQLALAVECPDDHIQPWLEKQLDYLYDIRAQADSTYLFHTVQFTEQTYEIVRHDLERALTAIHAKYPELLKRQYRPTGTEYSYMIVPFSLSGIHILTVLEWIVARACFKWEEAKITPQPPLELSIASSGAILNVSFDGVYGPPPSCPLAV